MVPTLAAGDRLLVRYGAPVRPGRLVLARFADGTLVVKRAVERRTTRTGSRPGGAQRQPRGRRGLPDRGAVADGDVLAVVAGPGLAATTPAARARCDDRRRQAACARLRSRERTRFPRRSELMVTNPDGRRHPVRRRPGVRPARGRQDGDAVDGRRCPASDELSLAYTPGVARVCEAIAADPSLTQHYTWVPNTVAVVTDGTAVLGLGDIGPAAAMPVMEGKAVLFKQFGGVDAVPICLDTTDVEEIIETVVRLAPSFGGINLEDISAPRCFEIEDRLKERLSIPVFHDDQHGTAVVALAALKNALRAHRPRPRRDPRRHLRCRRGRRRRRPDPARGRASATSRSSTARASSTPSASRPHAGQARRWPGTPPTTSAAPARWPT